MLVLGQVKHRVLAFLALFVAACAVYARSFHQFFISDDLTELVFVRRYSGSWLAFLDPAKMYSDPITLSRYRPVYVYYKWAVSALFGDNVVVYHAFSIGLHALTALGVLALAWKIFADRWTALVAAAIFLLARGQSQAVIWVASNFRLATVAVMLWGMVALFDGRRAVAVGLCVLAFVIAIGNPEFVIMPGILACFLVAYRFGRQANRDLAWRFGLATAGVTLVNVPFLYASAVSARAFPAPATMALPEPTRVVKFMANLFVQFEWPYSLKVALFVLIVVVVIALRDLRLMALLASSMGPAFVLGALRNYPLAPRYQYLPSIFTSIVLAYFVARISAWAAERVRSVPRWGFVAAMAGPLLIADIYALETLDIVHFEWMSRIGQNLADVRADVRRRGGEPARVFIEPESTLTPADLRYFSPELVIVASPDQATHVVSTEVERYRRILGPKMDAEYWYTPWFNGTHRK